MPYAICPGCDADVYVSGKPTLGRQTRCPECDAVLAVVSENPLELDWTEEEDEGLCSVEEDEEQ